MSLEALRDLRFQTTQTVMLYSFVQAASSKKTFSAAVFNSWRGTYAHLIKAPLQGSALVSLESQRTLWPLSTHAVALDHHSARPGAGARNALLPYANLAQSPSPSPLRLTSPLGRQQHPARPRLRGRPPEGALLRTEPKVTRSGNTQRRRGAK